MNKGLGGRATAFFLSLLMLFPLFSIQTEALPAEGQRRIGSRFLELIFGRREEEPQQAEPLYLCPGGEIFGIRIEGCGVTVAGIEEGAEDLPLLAGDRILSVNGTQVSSCEQLRGLIAASGGGEMEFGIERNGRSLALRIAPERGEGEVRLGILIKDSAAGIGTVTYVDPDGGAYGGLGHGICDGDSGEPLPMTGGEATGVILGGVRRGEAGAPGELRGVLTEKICGTVERNTPCGVFGRLSGAQTDYPKSRALPVGRREEVHEGAATIRSTLTNGRTEEYDVEIFDIDPASVDDAKSFRIRVRDPALVAATGGIVRGMSGSPIIQDGKLIGAVTHVMINDPTEGYGVFIENMLEAGEAAAQKSAA